MIIEFNKNIIKILVVNVQIKTNNK